MFGSRISPAAGDGDGDGERSPTGPALTLGAGIGDTAGGGLCWMIMTGAGEPLGPTDGDGTGGGVTSGGFEAGGGIRICGPPGAVGGPTYGG